MSDSKSTDEATLHNLVTYEVLDAAQKQINAAYRGDSWPVDIARNVDKIMQLFDQDLREKILKQALVKSEVVRWEKVAGEPVKMSNSPIVEIPIDDLMQLIHQRDKVRDAYVIGDDENEQQSANVDYNYQFERRNKLRREQRQRAAEWNKKEAA